MSKSVSLILPYYNRKEYLKASLSSFVYFYGERNDFQVVIIDDKSNEQNRLEDIVKEYNLNIKLIRIGNKKGINPCYPNNVGVRESEGDVIVLSSPEIVHTKSIFDVSDNFVELTGQNYLQFSVFCVTDNNIRSILMDTLLGFDSKLNIIDGQRRNFYFDLGFRGYSYATPLGAWYTHSKLKNSCFNFLSACSRNTYYELGGFNEEFVNGTGYDDTDFKDRILAYVDNNVIWYDSCEAIHIDHPAVSKDNNTNLALYNKLKGNSYGKNDDWGRL